MRSEQPRLIRGFDQEEKDPCCVAIIPARGGSRRIPGKNIRPFRGRPIIEHSIAKAFHSGLFKHVFVTTDDYATACLAAHVGASVLHRPAELAKDEIGTQQVAQHAVQMLTKTWAIPAVWACVIYPTAPLMSVQSLKYGRACIDMLGLDYAIGVGIEPLADAGQFYWGTKEAFLENKPLYDVRTAMVPIDADRVCDINTEDDWKRAEQMYDNLIMKGIQA